MRTTLTLDDDVAAALEQLRRARGGATFKTLVNDLLREGLKQLRARRIRSEPFRTQSVDLGRLRAGSLDNVADALAIAEGEAFR